jgi:lysophospholipase L1-like esterase
VSRTRPRTILAVLLVTAVTLVLLELTVRGWFAMQVGPRLLLYGTPWHRLAPAATTSDRSAGTHLNEFGGYRAYDPSASGYSKYFPHEEKFTPTPDRHGFYPVRINNQGLRGPDFTVEKAPGTTRVLTLGASSTFGYHDRDDETYPHYLEEDLNGRGAGAGRFEVINFGVPHATTSNILALFLAEGVPLRPDVVTFYEGANDAMVVEQGEPGLVGRAWEILRAHLLLAEFTNYALRFGTSDEAYAWSDELAARRSRAFLANLDRLHEECERRGIHLVVATQQLKSELVKPEDMKGLSYDAEVRLVRERVARGELGPSRRASWVVLQPAAALVAWFNSARALLVHARLMHDLRDWAAAHPDVGFVDVITLLDQDRDLLVNWVHLRAEANRRIADALASAILAPPGEPPDVAARVHP